MPQSRVEYLKENGWVLKDGVWCDEVKGYPDPLTEDEAVKVQGARETNAFWETVDEVEAEFKA